MALDITCIVTLHNEGILAHRTLKAVHAACNFANKAGLTTEIVVVVDRGLPSTLAVLHEHWPQLNYRRTDFGEPGLARNAGTLLAGGNYIAFIDGDDLICTDWLQAAWTMNQEDPRYVLHPEYNLYFDGYSRLMKHPNQAVGRWRDGGIAFDNYWSALSFAKRDVYRAVPYVGHQQQSGFGYEDWYFNCEAIAAGFRHRAVPKTVHFIRVKGAGGVSERNAANSAIMAQSSLFRQMASSPSNCGTKDERREATLNYSLPLPRSQRLLVLPEPAEIRQNLACWSQVCHWWDEAQYLTDNPRATLAVANGQAKCGFDHWVQNLDKNSIVLSSPANWNGWGYLALHADVANACAEKTQSAAWRHWLSYGAAEGRALPNRMGRHRAAPYPLQADEVKELELRWQEEEYLETHPDVALDVEEGRYASGWIHWCLCGNAQRRKLPELAWDDGAYLAFHPDVQAAVAQGAFADGYAHYRQWGAKEGRKLPMLRSPKWLITQMRDQSVTEPLLYPSDKFFSNCLFAGTSVERVDLGKAFAKMLAQVGTKSYTHVLVLPWLVRGGADIGALHHIHALAREFGARVLVVTTEPVVSPWLSRLPAEADCIDLAAFFPDRIAPETQLALVRLLLLVKAPVVHNINSELMWLTTAKFGRVLRKESAIFASLFAFGFASDGSPEGNPFFLDKTWAHLTAIFTDHQAFAATLVQLYGLSSKQVQVVRFPVSCVKRFSAPKKTTRPRFLWASRFAPEKRPDLLLKIAEAMPEVDFDVWGDTKCGRTTSKGQIIESLQNLPNVRLCGLFDGFDSIPTASYAALLYTTKSDGMPNILLEAVASGLLVVAPDVGGIAEVVDVNSPVRVADKDDFRAYCTCLSWVTKNFEEAQQLAAAQQAQVKNAHSVGSFAATLANIPTYSRHGLRPKAYNK